MKRLTITFGVVAAVFLSFWLGLRLGHFREAFDQSRVGLGMSLATERAYRLRDEEGLGRAIRTKLAADLNIYEAMQGSAFTAFSAPDSEGLRTQLAEYRSASPSK